MSYTTDSVDMHFHTIKRVLLLLPLRSLQLISGIDHLLFFASTISLSTDAGRRSLAFAEAPVFNYSLIGKASSSSISNPCLIYEVFETRARPCCNAITFGIQISPNLCTLRNFLPQRLKISLKVTWASSQFLSIRYWIPASSIMKANPPCSSFTFSTP